MTFGSLAEGSWLDKGECGFISLVENSDGTSTMSAYCNKGSGNGQKVSTLVLDPSTCPINESIVTNDGGNLKFTECS